MSSPAQGGAPAPQKEKTGLSRMFSRVKTIMRRAEKRMSAAGPSKARPVTAKPEPTPAPAKTEPTPAPAESRRAEPTYPDATHVPRMELYEERARQLGERFGLEVSLSAWHEAGGDVLRVEKPIRMRVHRTCHECRTDFGTAKQCPVCRHTRCSRCTRYPPKRTDAEKQAARARRAQLLKDQRENVPIVPDYGAAHKTYILTRPSRTGGQDLVYKKPRQRLRRTCCQCAKLFVGGNKACPGCAHLRCTDCPRDPAKKDKYPYGYPGDEFGARSVPHYKCHLCKTKFSADSPDSPNSPDSPDTAACAKCAHVRCTLCPRLKPQRVEPEPDPEILRAIEARLAGLRIA